MPHRADPLRPDSLRLTEDDLSNPALRSLLDDHLREMRANSPEGSMHALDPAAPRDPAVTFWSAWEDRDLVGCGALEQLDAAHGEIKSMRTASGHTRRGVATAIALPGDRVRLSRSTPIRSVGAGLPRHGPGRAH